MQPLDYLRAALVGVGVLVVTLLASIPMVAVYAHFINPGQPQAVYNAAAQWIAPWSSHVIGPLLFLWWNYRGAVRRPGRNAMAFAGASIVSFLIVDVASVVPFGLALSSALTKTFLLSLCVKTAGALLGAWLGMKRSSLHSPMLDARSHTHG